MAKNEAEAAVREKISSVESEQGLVAEVGSDPPPNWGHDSKESGGVSGHEIPGGGNGSKE